MVRRLVPALFACVLVLSTSVACGGDDDSDDGGPNPDLTATGSPGDEPTLATNTPKPANPDPETEPTLEVPASQFSLFHSDLGQGYLTDLDVTFDIDLQGYAGSRIFSSTEQGMEMLTGWGYIEGYETGYIPEGREQTVLIGGFYLNIETHLFETAEGAHGFYEHINSRLRMGSEELEAIELGNESTAWGRLGEPIGTSNVQGVLYWYVFRRGNMVAIVKTYGAYGLLGPEPAEVLARMVDEKALGRRNAVAPTPMGSGQ